MTVLRTRLAPTPSGLLHPGNALSFIITWCLCRAAGGRLLLRIDDLDAARRRPEYLEDIFRTLDWLGLDYDEGPAGVEDFLQRHSQHTRLDLYHAALDRLRAAGHLYACPCSRRQIGERSPDGRYPNTCRERGLPFDAPRTAWRVRVPEGTQVSFREWRSGTRSYPLAGEMGDFVVRRKNGLPAYQLASLVDDLHYEINFIVRGADLLASTAAQQFLAAGLDARPFREALFWHHPLLTGPDGEKLSKSKGAGSLQEWREAGRSPLPLFRDAGRWLNIDPEAVTSLETLLEAVREGGWRVEG